MGTAVLLLLRTGRLALFGICILILYNTKRMPVLWIAFPLWLVCVVHHGANSCGPGFGQKGTKLGLTALSFWPEVVSGSERASCLNVCLLCFFWNVFVYLMCMCPVNYVGDLF